ncbi:hypothetical protein J6590_103497, partial [Homalodisca vitripennis]
MGEVSAKKPSLSLNLGTNGLEVTSEPPPMKAMKNQCTDSCSKGSLVLQFETNILRMRGHWRAGGGNNIKNHHNEGEKEIENGIRKRRSGVPVLVFVCGEIYFR